MPSTSQYARSYPKRKRAEVKYYDSDSDERGWDDSEESAAEEAPAKKKLKGQDAKAISPKPLPKRKIFPFQSLPPELKNQIYDLVLRDDNGIFLISRTKRYRRTVERDVSNFANSTNIRAKRRRAYYGYSESQDAVATAPAELAGLVPNILLLNHEIYAEAQPILYGSNAFFLEDTTALHAFLATIGPKNRTLLTDLTLKGWGETKAHKAMNHPAFTLLGNAVNLQRLHIDCQIHWGGEPTSVAKQFYRESFHYLEDIGSAKGRSDAAVGVLHIRPENFRPYRYFRNQDEKPTPEENLETFREELRRLLRSS